MKKKYSNTDIAAMIVDIPGYRDLLKTYPPKQQVKIKAIIERKAKAHLKAENKRLQKEVHRLHSIIRELKKGNPDENK